MQRSSSEEAVIEKKKTFIARRVEMESLTQHVGEHGYSASKDRFPLHLAPPSPSYLFASLHSHVSSSCCPPFPSPLPPPARPPGVFSANYTHKKALTLGTPEDICISFNSCLISQDQVYPKGTDLRSVSAALQKFPPLNSIICRPAFFLEENVEQCGQLQYINMIYDNKKDV